LIALVQTEVRALAAAGVPDKPELPRVLHGLSFFGSAEVMTWSLDGIGVQTAGHVCFSNNAGRPIAGRRLAPTLDAIRSIDCDVLMFEFANREVSELDLMATLAPDFCIGARVVDVKNFQIEDAEIVASRIAECLAHTPASVWITADCDFSALPR